MAKFKPIKPFTLYKEGMNYNNPGKTSEFLGDLMRLHIEMGGVLVNVYRLKGVLDQDRDELGIKVDNNGSLKEATDIGSFMGIQDTVLMENRDLDWDFDEVPILSGVYTVSQNELDYARFGLMMANDVITMEFHAKEMEKQCGRRLIVGDVIEMPHLREVGIDGRVANKWYQIASITWSPTSYDAFYMRHVLGVILKPLRNQQEFLAFFEREDEYGKTLEEQATNKAALDAITEHNRDLAKEHAGTTWWDTSRMYIDPDNPDLKPYRWTDDLKPPNGIPVESGPEFPSNSSEGDWFIRTDLMPQKLYQRRGNRWRLREVDMKREWNDYNWVVKLREFMSDRSQEDRNRGWELRSVHDVLTTREHRSDPTDSEE